MAEKRRGGGGLAAGLAAPGMVWGMAGSRTWGQVGVAEPAKGRARRARYHLFNQQPPRRLQGTQKYSLFPSKWVVYWLYCFHPKWDAAAFSQIWMGRLWILNPALDFFFFLGNAKAKSRCPLSRRSISRFPSLLWATRAHREGKTLRPGFGGLLRGSLRAVGSGAFREPTRERYGNWRRFPTRYPSRLISCSDRHGSRPATCAVPFKKG